MSANSITSYDRGFTPNKTRYRRMMLVGYVSPTIIVIMTMITEKAAPECASLKPRIGDNSCFFAGNIDFVSIVWKIIVESKLNHQRPNMINNIVLYFRMVS